MMEAALSWLLTFCQLAFSLGAVGNFSGFLYERRPRELLAAVTFVAAGTYSYYHEAWWPLAAGLLLFWAYRRAGLVPADERGH